MQEMTIDEKKVVKIQYSQLGEEGNVPTVNARDLWGRLEVKTKFSM